MNQRLCNLDDTSPPPPPLGRARTPHPICMAILITNLRQAQQISKEAYCNPMAS